MVEVLSQYMVAAALMWATPGPNNMMLTNSGARFGFRKSMPHMLGIVTGTLLLLLCAISILNPLLTHWPGLMLGLRIFGSLWLVYLGWKMATAKMLTEVGEEFRPMSYSAALLFQFVNPKAYSATIALLSILLRDEVPVSTMVLALSLSPGLGLCCISPWVLAGMRIRSLLSTPRRWQLFSWLTGGLVAVCVVFIWL